MVLGVKIVALENEGEERRMRYEDFKEERKRGKVLREVERIRRKEATCVKDQRLNRCIA